MELDKTIAKETPPLFWLQGFEGVNQHDARNSIGEQECSWMENFMPLGAGNARSMYDNGAALYTTGGTIVYFFPFNIGANFYHAVFLADGSAAAVAYPSGVVTAIAAAATFAVTPTLPHCAQWGASGIVIVTQNTNGYFAWDGALYSPGGASPAWLSGLAAQISFTGDTHTNTTIDNITTTAGVVVGMWITGTDIPANTYVTAKTGTTLTISNAATGSHTVTLTIQWQMPTGIKGNAVETFLNRVWIANGAQFSQSAPANGADFSTADGGGTTKSSDSFLKVSYVNLKQSNGFLYLFGDASINVLSNVQTTGSPLTTTFNNQNVDPQTGIGWRDTLVAFGRALCFANPTGVYALFGGAAEKISDKIDRLFEKADFTTLPLTMFVCSIFNIRCLGLVLNTLDPTTNTQRNLVVLWNGQKWFIASQSTSDIFSAMMEKDSNPQAWGTDGQHLVQLFTTPSTAITKKVSSKLWAGRSNLIFKTAIRVYAETVDYAGSGVEIGGTLDSGNNVAVAFSITSNLFWINNSSLPIVFVNNLSQALQFVSSPPGVVGADANQAGRRLGITLQSTSQDFALIGCGEAYNEETIYG